MQRSDSLESPTRGAGLRLGSLAGRLAVLLAVFIVLATVAVVVREYGVGEERLVAETNRTLTAQAVVAAHRLADALAERQRLVDLWAALETSQDLGVDDVDTRVSRSLTDLVVALGGGTEAVAARAGAILSASDPARLGEGASALPRGVLAALTAAEPGLYLRGSRTDDPDPGVVVASADVVSAVDGGVLGRIVVWTPLAGFLSASIPVELTYTLVSGVGGVVLSRGEALEGADEGYLWASHTAPTVAGDVEVAVARPRAEVVGVLRESGRQLVTLAFLFLVLALPAALVVVHSATSSLGRLTRAARELDARNPGPIPEASPWAPSEVRVLADAMSNMVTRLEEARGELARSESLAAVGMLTKSLAHEIRTPLSVLRAGTEILARSPQGPREREVTEMLEAEVERLARLVDDLLVFGRPSPPAPRPVALRELCAGAVSALDGEAREKGVSLVLEGDEVTLPADPDQLRQVMVNLVTNAIRACDGGGCVVVRVAAEGADAVIEVEDDGVGIEAERLDDIWRPLVTTYRSGNGLGLPIVRQLVEAHGGRVEVLSTLGEGTCMRVVLPIQPVEKA